MTASVHTVAMALATVSDLAQNTQQAGMACNFSTYLAVSALFVQKVMAYLNALLYTLSCQNLYTKGSWDRTRQVRHVVVQDHLGLYCKHAQCSQALLSANSRPDSPHSLCILLLGLKCVLLVWTALLQRDVMLLHHYLRTLS